GPPEIACAIGLDDATAAALPREPVVAALLAGEETGARTANGVLGLPALALAPFAADTGERAVVGVARRDERPFEEACPRRSAGPRGPSTQSATSTWRSNTARRWRCSAPTAPASRRRSKAEVISLFEDAGFFAI